MDTRTILVLDDDVALRAMLDEALSEEGYRVVGVADLPAAAAALANDSVDLVLADALRMTAAGGWGDPWVELDRLRALAAGTPIVVVTGQRPADYVDWSARGFAGLLPKPFDLTTLFTLIRDALPARQIPHRAAGGAR